MKKRPTQPIIIIKESDEDLKNDSEDEPYHEVSWDQIDNSYYFSQEPVNQSFKGS